MSIRIPRGYEVNRPYYQEISKGERLAPTSLPLEAWADLAVTRVDEYQNDPFVIEPGTIVGYHPTAVDSRGMPVLVPAVFKDAANAIVAGTVTQTHHTDSAKWGITTTATYSGIIKPVGVVYQPIYSFALNSKFTNYKRNVNVGLLTDYVIQVPAVTTLELTIKGGDSVMLADGDTKWGSISSAGLITTLAGRYAPYKSSLVGAEEFIVGKCLSSVKIATTSASAAGLIMKTELAAGRVSLTAAGTSLFKDLARVSTVPGHGLSGDGTSGIPGWLLGGTSDGSGDYYALTILVRL
jgi:hypothetical protein